MQNLILCILRPEVQNLFLELHPLNRITAVSLPSLNAPVCLTIFVFPHYFLPKGNQYDTFFQFFQLTKASDMGCYRKKFRSNAKLKEASQNLTSRCSYSYRHWLVSLLYTHLFRLFFHSSRPSSMRSISS